MNTIFSNKFAALEESNTALHAEINQLKDPERRDRRSPSYVHPDCVSPPPDNQDKGKEKDVMIAGRQTASAQAADDAKTTRSSEMDRWRVEEVGYFDGSGDVYEFMNRLNSIGSIKPPRLISKNIVTCFLKDGGLKEAYNWWIKEINFNIRKILQVQNYLGPFVPHLKGALGLRRTNCSSN